MIVVERLANIRLSLLLFRFLRHLCLHPLISPLPFPFSQPSFPYYPFRFNQLVRFSAFSSACLFCARASNHRTFYRPECRWRWGGGVAVAIACVSVSSVVVVVVVVFGERRRRCNDCCLSVGGPKSMTFFKCLIGYFFGCLNVSKTPSRLSMTIFSYRVVNAVCLQMISPSSKCMYRGTTKFSKTSSFHRVQWWNSLKKVLSTW